VPDPTSRLPTKFSVTISWPRTPLLLRLAYGIRRQASPPYLRFRTHLCYAVTAAIPLIGFLLPRRWGISTQECPPFNRTLLVDYTILNYFQLLFSTMVWERVRAHSHDVDELLEPSNTRSRSSAIQSLHRMLSVQPQIAVVAIGPFVGILNTALLIGASDGRITRCAPTDLLAIMTGLIATHSAYWIACGVYFYAKVVRIPNLALTWNAPINTPGLVALSDVARLSARLGFVLFLMTQLPLTWAYITIPTTSMAVIYFSALFLTASFVTIFGIGVQTQLSRRVRNEKRSSLSELAHEIESLRSELQSTRPKTLRYLRGLYMLKFKIDIYRQIDSSSSSYMNAAVIAQYGASLAAVVFQLGLTAAIVRK
jgi:hypothetical protein